MAESAGTRAKRAVSHPYERQAVRLLHQAGWSVGELTMTFQASERAIRAVLHDTGGDEHGR